MLLTSEVMSLQGFSCACIEFCFTYLLQIRLSLLEKGFGSCMGVQAPPLPQCSAGYIYIYPSVRQWLSLLIVSQLCIQKALQYSKERIYVTSPTYTDLHIEISIQCLIF